MITCAGFTPAVRRRSNTRDGHGFRYDLHRRACEPIDSQPHIQGHLVTFCNVFEQRYVLHVDIEVVCSSVIFDPTPMKAYSIRRRVLDRC